MKTEKRVHLPDVVGKGYGTFWRSKKRYAVVKGSRGSKKSKTAALWLITKLMEYPQANALVVRKTERTLRDSCFSDLRWAISRLKVDAWWKATTSPLELVYVPTGQKVIFRGLDDPLKITSISVPVGILNFVWIEEAYEIMHEADFDFIDESIRGDVPEGYFKRINITFNPWSDGHWLKKRFFDQPNDDVLAMTTTWECNEWLDESDRKLFADMKERNPRRYRVAGLGEWGITEGLVFENVETEADFTLDSVRHLPCNAGLDFGWIDPLAFVVNFIDQENHTIYIWDELYQSGLSNKAAFDRIVAMGYGKQNIVADCAEPKSIDELRGYGLKVSPARKGRDSVMQGIRFLQDYKIVVHKQCVNFQTEILNYAWKKDKFGKLIDEPEDAFNHLIDGLRYSCEQYMRKSNWLY